MNPTRYLSGERRESGREKAFDLGRSIEGSVVNFGFLTLSKVLVQVLHLGTLALITRQLGPAVYGKMSVFLMVTQFLYLVTCSWTAVGYTRYATIYGAEGRRSGEVFWCRNLVVLVPAALSVLLLVFARSLVLDYLDLPSPIIWIALFHLLTLVCSDYVRQMAQVSTEFKKLSVAQVLQQLLTLILVWVLGKGIIPILWIFIAVSLAVQVGTALLLPRSLYLPFRVDREMCRRLVLFSYPFLLTAIGGFLFGWVDIAVIKQVASMEQVGVYSLAYSGLGTIESVALLMTTVLTPIFVSLAHRDRGEAMGRFVGRVIPQICYFWGAATLFSGLASIWFIPWMFGRAFFHSTPVFLALLLNLYLSVFNSLCVPVFVAYNRVRKMVLITFSASVLNLVLDVLLVPRVGIMGAAAATLCAYAFVSGWYCVLIGGRFPLAMGKLFLFLGIVSAQLCGLLLFGGSSVGVAVTGAAAAVYLAGAKAMAVFSPGDESIYASLNLPAPLKRLLFRVCAYCG